MADSAAEAEPTPEPAQEPLPARGRWFGVALMVAMAAVLVLNVAWVVRNFSLLRTMGPGKQAPAFELETLNGDKIRLADLKGRVVLIDFWSVTCPPCLETLPKLNKIVDKFADAPVSVLAIHTQGGRRWRMAARVETRPMKLKFPVLMDTRRGKVSESYTVRVLPTTVLVGRDGTIKKVWRGSTSVDDMIDEIRSALK